MRPVFIVGAGRSGTTLLGSILGSLPGCGTVPEAQFFADLCVLGERRRNGEIDGPAVRSLLLNSRRFRNAWGVHVLDALPAGRAFSARAWVEQIVAAYLADQGSSDMTVWIDHTPENVLRLPLLSDVFPDARFVHVVRDVRAVCASVLKLDWGFVDVLQATNYWITNVANGLAAELHPTIGPRVTRVRYEDLIEQPERTLRAICGFCALDYVAGLHQRRSFNLPSQTKSQHRLVEKPIDRDRIEAWRSELNSRQVEQIEYLCCHLLASLGYRPEYGAAARRPLKREKAIILLKRVAGKPWQRLRNRWRNRQLGWNVGRPLRRLLSGGAAIR